MSVMFWTLYFLLAGAVAKVGELDSGGHPIYEYAVRDIRVAKAICPQLQLSEFMRYKLRTCPRCSTIMIRDWDLGLAQTCHGCEIEWPAKSVPLDAPQTEPTE
jgi:hypothetical protein